MTGSVASLNGFPCLGVHAASNAALRSFARTRLNKLKGRNIRVNLLSLGQTDTSPSQRLDMQTREMFKILIPRERWVVLFSTDANRPKRASRPNADVNDAFRSNCPNLEVILPSTRYGKPL
jgi:NAD(P)-dependent dehydrogenase (short-subunit alcohol dehydrogenase family)